MQATGLLAMVFVGATAPVLAATSGSRRDTIGTIIVHAVSGPSCAGGTMTFCGAPGDADTWKRFFEHHPFLAIHYVVDRAGRHARGACRHCRC